MRRQALRLSSVTLSTFIALVGACGSFSSNSDGGDAAGSPSDDGLAGATHDAAAGAAGAGLGGAAAGSGGAAGANADAGIDAPGVDASPACAGTSPSACGSSCTACPVPTGGTAACNAGKCELACPTGTQACDRSMSCLSPGQACAGQCPSDSHACGNSCKADNDATACGTDCRQCPAGPNATAVCSAGTCGLTCSDPKAPNKCADGCYACCSNDQCPAKDNAVATCTNHQCAYQCTAITCGDGTCLPSEGACIAIVFDVPPNPDCASNVCTPPEKVCKTNKLRRVVLQPNDLEVLSTKCLDYFDGMRKSLCSDPVLLPRVQAGEIITVHYYVDLSGTDGVRVDGRELGSAICP